MRKLPPYRQKNLEEQASGGCYSRRVPNRRRPKTMQIGGEHFPKKPSPRMVASGSDPHRRRGRITYCVFLLRRMVPKRPYIPATSTLTESIRIQPNESRPRTLGTCLEISSAAQAATSSGGICAAHLIAVEDWI